MSRVETLPDVVIQTIFDCQPELSNEWDCWKDHLLYISVCRRWRALLAPRVFRKAYVAYLGDRKEPRDTMIGEKQGVCTLAMRHDTNVDLLRTLGRVGMVRRVQILVVTWSDLNKVNAHVSALFGFATEDWTGVAELEVEIMDASYNPEQYSPGDNPAVALAAQISRAMPGVTRMSYDNHWRLVYPDDLFAQLANAYSRNLTCLNARFKIPLGLLCPPISTLTHLDIALDDAAFRGGGFHVFNPTLLKILRIHGDRLFSWNVFAADNGGICFKNLVVFELAFDEYPQEYVATDGNPVVSFPELRWLNIEDCSSAGIFTCCRFPHNMPHICYNSKHIGLTELYQKINVSANS